MIGRMDFGRLKDTGIACGGLRRGGQGERREKQKQWDIFHGEKIGAEARQRRVGRRERAYEYIEIGGGAIRASNTKN
jgi:hypothetical protein